MSEREVTSCLHCKSWHKPALCIFPEVWSISLINSLKAFHDSVLLFCCHCPQIGRFHVWFHTNACHMPWISEWLEVRATGCIITLELGSGLWQVPVSCRPYKQLDSSLHRCTGRQRGKASCVDKRCTQKQSWRETLYPFKLAGWYWQFGPHFVNNTASFPGVTEPNRNNPISVFFASPPYPWASAAQLWLPCFQGHLFTTALVDAALLQPALFWACSWVKTQKCQHL